MSLKYYDLLENAQKKIEIEKKLKKVTKYHTTTKITPTVSPLDKCQEKEMGLS